MSVYEPLMIGVILLQDTDCICASGDYSKDYDDNELPLIPF